MICFALSARNLLNNFPPLPKTWKLIKHEPRWPLLSLGHPSRGWALWRTQTMIQLISISRKDSYLKRLRIEGTRTSGPVHLKKYNREERFNSLPQVRILRLFL
jgi:hypothetical protein